MAQAMSTQGKRETARIDFVLKARSMGYELLALADLARDAGLFEIAAKKSDRPVVGN